MKHQEMTDPAVRGAKGGSGEDWMTTTAGLLLGWMGRRFGMGLSEREREWREDGL